ncbi:hypothetical protein BDW68DRAFT_173097 [Aspergillus falconensis]
MGSIPIWIKSPLATVENVPLPPGEILPGPRRIQRLHLPSNPPPLDLHYSVSSTANELAGGLPGSSFNPERDVSDPSGKAIFVTGETVLQLVRHRPERIYLAARTATKAQTAVASIRETLPHPANIRHIPLDLALFASIRAPAKQFQSECDRLDILILKAGVMAHSPSLTEEGYEIHLGTNHIGHFLIKLPLPTPREKLFPAPYPRMCETSH